MKEEDALTLTAHMGSESEAAALRLLNSNLSYCERCGKPWSHCEGRTVMTSKHYGTFAVCKDCWSASTLAELKIFYTAVYRDQAQFSPDHVEHSLDHLLACVEAEYQKEHQ